MKKFFEYYDKFAQWLCHFQADMYVHMIVGVLIGFFASLVFAETTNNGTPLAYALCGVIAASLIMLIKELTDFFREESFDAGEWLSGTIGGMIGVLLYLI